MSKKRRLQHTVGAGGSGRTLETSKARVHSQQQRVDSPGEEEPECLDVPLRVSVFSGQQEARSSAQSMQEEEELDI